MAQTKSVVRNRSLAGAARGRRPLAVILALLLAASLGGCGAVITGRGPAVLAPQITDNRLRLSDGLERPLTSWQPSGPPRAVLLALHGFGDYAHAFALPGPFWASRGIATFAYDQRGFGDSQTQGLWPGDQALIADAREAVTALKARYPGVPFYLLGESMGGAVAISLLADADAPTVDGLILSAPAVWGYDDVPFPGVLLLDTLAFVMPWNWPSPPPGWHIEVTDNRPILEAMRQDPFMMPHGRNDTLQGLLHLMDHAGKVAGRVRPPVLLLTGLRDQVVPWPALNRVADQLAGRGCNPLGPSPGPACRQPGDLRRIDYSRGYHLLLRDRQGPRLWRDIAAWIADPAGPLPSDGRD